MPASPDIHYSLAIKDVHDPKNREDLEKNAPLIIAAYRGVRVDEIGTLTQGRIDHALAGVKQGDYYVTVEVNGQKTGILSWKERTRGTAPEFYQAIQEGAQTQPSDVRALLEQITGVITIEELAVLKELGAKGIAKRMRLESLTQTGSMGKILMGDIESARSLKTREVYEAPTVWARTLINPSKTDLPRDIILGATDVLTTGYLKTFSPKAHKTYDPDTGTHRSGAFDYAQPSLENLSNEQLMAAQRIVNERQKMMRKGHVISSIATTIFQGSRR